MDLKGSQNFFDFMQLTPTLIEQSWSLIIILIPEGQYMIAPKVRPDRLNVYWQFLALLFLTDLKKLVKILSSSKNFMKAFEN